MIAGIRKEDTIKRDVFSFVLFIYFY